VAFAVEADGVDGGLHEQLGAGPRLGCEDGTNQNASCVSLSRFVALADEQPECADILGPVGPGYGIESASRCDGVAVGDADADLVVVVRAEAPPESGTQE